MECMSTMVETDPKIIANRSSDKTRRNRVTSGKALLAGVDGRTREAKRYRDCLDALLVQYDISDESDQALARRYASLSVFSELEEAKQARGEPCDTERMIRAANTQRRLRNALEASHKVRQKRRTP
jgi:hypothetical protein